MRILWQILGLLLLSSLLGMNVYAQPQKCDIRCQEHYVRQFAKILSKNKPDMVGYFALFSEPEGPEGMRLFNIKKRHLIIEENEHHVQEMTIAGDAFDEVTRRDRTSRSFYLTCLHKRYLNRLPNEKANLASSVDASSQLTLITVSTKNSRWKFVFSDGESKPDSVIAPDGVELGDMDEDPCVLSCHSQ